VSPIAQLSLPQPQIVSVAPVSEHLENRHLCSVSDVFLQNWLVSHVAVAPHKQSDDVAIDPLSFAHVGFTWHVPFVDALLQYVSLAHNVVLHIHEPSVALSLIYHLDLYMP